VFFHPTTGFQHRLGRPLHTLLADPGPTHVGTRRRQVVSISSALPKKDWNVLFEAVAGADVRLEVAIAVTNGFESLPEQIAEEFSRRGLDGRVMVNVPYAVGQDALRQSAALVYSLAAEQPVGQPCSVFEGAIAGTPLVVPDNPAVRNLVGDIAHYYVRGSSDSMAHAILEARDRPHDLDTRRSLADRVRERHCGDTAKAAWAESLTSAVVSWQHNHRPGQTRRAQRWWQPA
jgi:glycosyltransferase involved in cell wall biosynthesis